MHVIGNLFVFLSGSLLLFCMYEDGRLQKSESAQEAIERVNAALLTAELTEFKRRNPS